MRLLDHDGLAHMGLAPADDSQPASSQQPAAKPAAASMFLTMLGTPGKMAPNVAAHALGKDASAEDKRAAADAAKNPKSDIFLLGILLLQLLMGCNEHVTMVSSAATGRDVQQCASGCQQRC